MGSIGCLVLIGLLIFAPFATLWAVSVIGLTLWDLITSPFVIVCCLLGLGIGYLRSKSR